MSRSKNSRRGSRKGHWWKRPDCSCFLCASPAEKKQIYLGRAHECDKRIRAHECDQYPAWVEDAIADFWRLSDIQKPV